MLSWLVTCPHKPYKLYETVTNTTYERSSRRLCSLSSDRRSLCALLLSLSLCLLKLVCFCPFSRLQVGPIIDTSLTDGKISLPAPVSPPLINVIVVCQLSVQITMAAHRFGLHSSSSGWSFICSIILTLDSIPANLLFFAKQQRQFLHLIILYFGSFLPSSSVSLAGMLFLRRNLLRGTSSSLLSMSPSSDALRFFFLGSQ